MGKRGPEPVARGALYKTVRAFYSEFLDLAGLRTHWEFDYKSYEALKAVTREISDEDRTKFEQREEMIRVGLLSRSERQKRYRQLEEDMEWARRERTLNFAYERSRRKTKPRAEPDVIRELLAATEPERVREICETRLGPVMVSVFNPRTMKSRRQRAPVRKHFLKSLSHYAERFISAKNHAKFPHGRPRSTLQLEQLWFLSRAVAAATRGSELHSALKLGAKRPEQRLAESRTAKSNTQMPDARQAAIHQAKTARLAKMKPLFTS